MRVDVHDNIKEVLSRFKRVEQAVLDQAIPRALNRTGEMARTEASRQLRAEGYNFRHGEILNAIRLTKATRARMTVVMGVRRRAKLLLQFAARETKDGVRVRVKGQAKLIRGAFIGQLRNGEHAVFLRDESAGKTVLRMGRTHKHGSKGGWQSQPVRKLYGPSVGGGYASDAVQSAMAQFIRARLSDRLTHEIKRALR